MKRKDGKRNAPGQGRHIAPETILKATIRTIVERYPELNSEMINKALPQQLRFKCKKCRTVNVIERVPGTGDREMLIHLDERVMGKATTNVNFGMRNQQFDNSQLSKLYLDVISFGDEMKLVRIEDVEAQVKLIEMPGKQAKTADSRSYDVPGVSANQESYVQDGSQKDAFKNQQEDDVASIASDFSASGNVEMKTASTIVEMEQELVRDWKRLTERQRRERQAAIAELKGEGGEGVDPGRRSEVLLVGSPSAEVKNPNVDKSGTEGVEVINFATGEGVSEVELNNKNEGKSEHWTAVEPEGDDIEKVVEKLKTRSQEIEAERVEISSWA